MSFASLGLDATILKAVADQGYTEPTPIQKATIPVILEAKYLHELGAKRRFESDIIWGSVTFAFR